MDALALRPLSPALRWLPVLSDNMEPELRVGRDLVLVQAGGWSGEGMYVDHHDAIYQCDAVPGGRICTYGFNRFYPTKTYMTGAEFASWSAGKVVAALRLHDTDAIQRLWGAVGEGRRAASVSVAA